MGQELLYQVALSLIPNIGPVQARILVEHFGDAESVFRARLSQLKIIEGIGEIRGRCIVNFTSFRDAEREISFIEKYKITPLFFTNPDYPRRLLNCYDTPVLLYYKGNTNLNASRVISVVGTRNNTAYGKLVTEKLIKELAGHQALIVSGLAYGIDAIAHSTALKHELPTVGVLAHGLDQIYPPAHAGLAKDMTKLGGLLSEFRSSTNPDKHNFPTRNRIVAGISDATIVIETGNKGGSMITAELANSYNRDVFAFPGKVTDHKSSGCNTLIRQNKAVLLTDTQELLEIMGWDEQKKIKPRVQKEIFIELSPDEKVIIDILKEKVSVHIDEINLKSMLSSSAVAAAILNLELQNVIASFPGKMYGLQ